MNKNYYDIDIANFIVELAIENKKELPIYKLHQMLYFINAQFLIETGESLLNNKFQRWTFGPVNLEIRDYAKKFGSKTINQTMMRIESTSVTPFFNSVPFDNTILAKSIKNKIAKTFDEIIDVPLSELVDITTHQEIYTKYADAIMTYDAPEYQDTDIIQQFSNHPNEQLWS